jgi:hypothetical protein
MRSFIFSDRLEALVRRLGAGGRAAAFSGLT